MSNVDYRQHLLHAVSGLRTQGLTTAEIVALVIGETPKAATPVAALAPDTEKLVPIQLANGLTKLVPASAVPAKANTHTVQQAGCAVEWIRPDGFVPDVIPDPDPAPKPANSDEHEIVFVPSRGTTHDLFNERYQTEWEPPAVRQTAPETADIDYDALIREAEADLVKIRELRATHAK